jgi:transposase-like protein
VQVPLPLVEDLVAVRESFFELCIETGQQVLESMMEQDRVALCGARWSRDPQRQAVRGGSVRGEVTLGGRRIALRRLRARTREGDEATLPSFAFAAAHDALDARTLEAIAAGVSTRRYARSLEPLPAGMAQRAVSRSAVSRRFVALSQEQLRRQLARPLHELDVRVLLVDGIEFRDHTILLALGILVDGRKVILGLREGSTENATVARALLADLVERGLSADRMRLYCVDGSKALRRAIREVFGVHAPVQRCQVHKARNVRDHLPPELQPGVMRAMRDAYASTGAALAARQLERLASSLERAHPGAAASLREGLEETLTLQRLGIGGALYRTLRSTNVIENLNGSIARYTRNVQRWRGGAMILRWVGSALVEAERGFRRIRGCASMPKLIRALEQQEARLRLDSKKKVA